MAQNVDKIVKIFYLGFILLGVGNISLASEIQNFHMFDKCTDDICQIYSQKRNVITTYDDKPGIYKLKKINNTLYHIEYGCGGACLSNVFIGASKEDWSHTLIASNDTCLIEYDMESNTFLAREVFLSNKKEVLKLDDNAYLAAMPIWLYHQNSSFIDNTFKVSVLQKNGKYKNYSIKFPCQN